MGNTLMELTEEFLELWDILSITDPDDDEMRVIEDTLEGVTGEIGIKADGYAVVIDRLLGESATRKKMADKLAKSAKALENHAESLKDKLKYCMEQMDTKKIEGEYFTFRIQKNGGKQSVKIKEGAEVPQMFTRVIVEPDKELIRNALEDGQELDFAYLEERGTHLRIS